MAKKEKKPKSKVRKVFDWVITCLFGGLFITVAIFQLISINSAKTNYGVPNFNGHQTLVVLTDSMQPDYMVGSAVFVNKVDPSTLKVGDDITFYYSPWSYAMSNPIVTHRIREIKINEGVEVGNGYYTFVCGGINKDSDQAWEVSGHTTRDCTYQHQDISEQYVLGKVVGNSKFVGAIYSFITSIWGLLTLLLIPCLYLIITSVIDLFKALKEPEEEKLALDGPSDSGDKPSSLSNLSDEDKERLKKEMLNEMLGDKDK